MTSAIARVFALQKEHQVRFVDLRFTDTRGKEQHVCLPASILTESFFKEGKMFDGSSIAGWQPIHESDMLLLPDPTTVVRDPFYEESTLILRCDVMDPNTQQGYARCPRTVAKRAEAYLASTGLADTVLFGPEPEFFIFDDVRFENTINKSFYSVDSDEGAWNSKRNIEGGNTGHRPGLKGGYFPVPPVDSAQDLRSHMCVILEEMGLIVEAHHHEVATGNQNEIATQCASLVRKADEIQILKYVVQNVAHRYGKTATFMPKPLVGDNGSGMHCHQSLSKNGTNIFAGSEYAGLSETALFYIGGIIHHAKALNAITNSTTNSYKRLVPGFEAPVFLAYSSRNRSAAIRIPFASSSNAKRIEVRFPDPLSNPYLAFSAMMMAGLDGIKKEMHPGNAIEKDLYHIPPSEARELKTVAHSLDEALHALDRDRGFLKEGGVFSDALIDSYLALKEEEVTRLRMSTHPVEFEMYYSL